MNREKRGACIADNSIAPSRMAPERNCLRARVHAVRSVFLAGYITGVTGPHQSFRQHSS